MIQGRDSKKNLIFQTNCDDSFIKMLHNKWHVELFAELNAHLAEISSLEISDEFHVLLSTSIDGTICLWDSNRFLNMKKIIILDWNL